MKKLLLLFIPLFLFCLQNSITAQIAVTEFINDPSGDDSTDEWVELFNFSNSSVDIEDWTIEDEGDDSDVITSSSFTIASGEFVILAKNKSAFESQWLGGTPNVNVIQVAGLTLANGADEIILKDNAGTVIWSLAYSNDDATGRATFLAEDNFSTTTYGSEASPGVDRNDNDVTGTIGYERNNHTADGNAATLGGDTGSPFLGGYTPLPVDLISFNAKNVNQSIINLSWQTASEENNSHFEVEHSTNGRDFQMLDKVIGNGTTAEIQQYNYMHEEAANGKNYYRLRQVDFDGAFEYSDVAVVEIKGEGQVQIRPTLANENVTLAFGETTRQETQVQIIDIAGRQVMATSIASGTEQIDLSVATLEKGLYFVQLALNGELTTLKFVKQ